MLKSVIHIIVSSLYGFYFSTISVIAAIIAVVVKGCNKNIKAFNLHLASRHFFFQPSDTTDQPTGPTSDAAAAAPALVIWGTDVVVSETKEKFRKFISEFVDEEAEDMGEGFDPLLPVYMQRLDEASNKVYNDLNWPVMSITERQVCSLRKMGGSPVL